jgi:hypothetical protein
LQRPQRRRHANAGGDQLASPGVILLIIDGNQDDVGTVDAHEQRLARGMLERADDRDLPADGLKAVADRTIAQFAFTNRLPPVRKRGLFVDDPGGEDHPLRRDETALVRGDNILGTLLKRAHGAPDNGHVKFPDLPFHPRK